MDPQWDWNSLAGKHVYLFRLVTCQNSMDVFPDLINRLDPFFGPFLETKIRGGFFVKLKALSILSIYF